MSNHDERSQRIAPLPPAVAEFAHELRGPLGGIDAMIALLASTALDDEQARLVDALRASAAHLCSLANAVLAPETAAGAKAQPQVQPFSTFIDQVVVSFQSRAQAAGLEFLLTIAAPFEPGHFLIEAGPLRQVLENLIDNAIRLTPAGMVQLALTHAEPGRVSLAVCDDGPGLSNRDAERLIRSGGQIKGRAGGAGIGLSIAGRLVSARGGILRGGPRDDRPGACFIFDWPLVAAEDTKPEEKKPGEESCLIVDDHPASRLVLSTILASQGIACAGAADIAAAWHAIQRGRYRAVFTDLRMPDGHGSQLIEKMTSLGLGQRPAIVVVSGDPIEALGGLAHRIDGYLAKPITIKAVLDMVSALKLDPAQGQAAA